MAGSSERKRTYEDMIKSCTSRRDKPDMPFIHVGDVEISEEDRRYVQEVADMASRGIATSSKPRGSTSPSDEDKSFHHMSILEPNQRNTVRQSVAQSLATTTVKYTCSGCQQYFYKSQLLPLHPQEDDWQGFFVRMCFDCVQCTADDTAWRPDRPDDSIPKEDTCAEPRHREADEWETCAWQVVTSREDDQKTLYVKQETWGGRTHRSTLHVWWHHCCHLP
jgi:hypothetical protein